MVVFVIFQFRKLKSTVVKLKCNLEHKGHVVFQAVRPDVVFQFLDLLRCLDEPIEVQLE